MPLSHLSDLSLPTNWRNMEIQGVQVQNYIYHFLKNISLNYSFNGKNVLFLYGAADLDNARVIEKFGAKNVWFMSYDLEFQKLENENITLLNLSDIDHLKKIDDKSIDLIIGLEVLEHIYYIRGFIDEVKRILKDGGSAILQGFPVWTSKFGHHLWVEDKFIFNNYTNPLEPWEHLTFKNAQDAIDAMVNKGYTKEDGKLVADWIFGEEEINCLSPSEMFVDVTKIPYDAEKFGHKINKNGTVETYKTDDFSYNFKRIMTDEKPNKYFEQALSKYSEEDLKTEECVLTISKKRACQAKEEIEFPELPYFRRVVFEQFFKKYSLKDANVLNISYYDNNFYSKLLKKHGAKAVTGVSPMLKNEKIEEIEGIENVCRKFEDFDGEIEKFDIIIGFDVIQNINDFEKFCIKLNRYSNLATGIHIDGYTPYTSACGHSFCSKNHNFFDETNPLDHWEHLSLKTEEDFRNALKRHNIADEEIEEIIFRYFKDEPILKMTPTEIEEELSKNLTVDVRRIYRYYPENEHYKKALEGYNEDDLNVERLIITSDIPNLLWLDELNLDKNYELNVSDINLKYKLPDKRVLSISPQYCNYAITEGLEALRAKEIVSLGAYYSGYELRCGTNVKCTNQKWQDIENLRGKFDIIYGIEVLEHVKDLKKFFETLKNLVADNGVICLQGRPLWTSDEGHNCTAELDSGFLQTGEEKMKISPWQHLAFENQSDLKNSLSDKGFSENDADKIADFIFNSDEINRLSFSKILDILNEVDGLFYGTKKVLDYSDENEFYEIASKKYTHEELRTKELSLSIRKKMQ